MKKIKKKSGAVYFSDGAWNYLTETINEISPSKIFVLVDTNTKQDCLPFFLTKFDSKIIPEIVEINDGEINKNITTCIKVWNRLSEKKADRNSLLINLGGGMVTDLGGFVASTFKRGINFINIPTSLLAMVDASVGGKTGVDLGILKNQIGIINNPKCVIIDTHFLKTLAQQQIISGYAEMLKHGLIHSKEYWNSIKNYNITNTDSIEELLWQSVLIKNDIISEDPYEKGIRKILNYGHTLGHAIESYCLENKKLLLHGEAVAIGMILASYISTKTKGFSNKNLEDITYNILKQYKKIIFSTSDIEAICKLLIFDKKNRNGKILFVLLEDIGKAIADCEVPNRLIYEAFDYYKNYT